MHPELSLALYAAQIDDEQRRARAYRRTAHVARRSGGGIRRYFAHGDEAHEQPLRREGRSAN